MLHKLNGSLGFTLRKQADAATGEHRISALVREPAASDGRLRAGDLIAAVNGVPMAGMRHEEAVAFLRACDAARPVRLRLCRRRSQTSTAVATTSTKQAETIDEMTIVEPAVEAATKQMMLLQQTSCDASRQQHAMRATAVRGLSALADRSKLFNGCDEVVTAC